jgi:hypothetical protein
LKGILVAQKGGPTELDDPEVALYRSNQNLIFNELSKFVQFFINFGLRFDTSNDLLLELCEHYLMDSSRTHLLLTEL